MQQIPEIPEKRGPGRPKKVMPAVLSSDQDAPVLDQVEPLETRLKKSVRVVDRRLKGDAIFGSPSKSIPMKDPKMFPRWFNRAIRADKFFEAENEKGWIKVHVSDVASQDAISGYVVTGEGYVTRGPRGDEMLYMMPREQYKQIQQAKDAANRSRLGSKAKRIDHVAEGAAATLGPQAADFIREEGGPTIETYREAPDEWKD